MTDEQFRTLEAATQRVLPSGDGPGAAEANVIAYVRWLVSQPSFSAAARQRLTAGVALLDALARALWGKPFAACPPGEQEAVLAKLHETPHPTAQRFLVTLVRMTVSGFLCPPTYGGNRDRIGWDFIGFAAHPMTRGSSAPALGESTP